MANSPAFPFRPRSYALSAGASVAWFLSAAVLVAASDSPPAAPAKAESRSAPVPTHRVVPAHPAELLKSLTNGEAEIECLVTAEGKVTEAKVRSASHPEFGEAALAAARQWEFRPGARGGVPVAMRVHLPFAFEIAPDQALEVLAGHALHEEIKETIVPAAQLPSWPSPKKILLPRYPVSLKGSGKYGKAVVAIVINKEGKVIRPRIVKYTHEEFIWPALVTAASLEFVPIKVGKEPIYVSMELQYDFKADAGKPKEEAPGPAKPAKAAKPGKA